MICTKATTNTINTTPIGRSVRRDILRILTDLARALSKKIPTGLFENAQNASPSHTSSYRGGVDGVGRCPVSHAGYFVRSRQPPSGV